MIRGMIIFFQAEDGIRIAQESRGLGDVYKRQGLRDGGTRRRRRPDATDAERGAAQLRCAADRAGLCLLYPSDAADDLPCVDLGGRRIITKKNNLTPTV